MKTENYKKVVELMEKLNTLLQQSHDLSQAKYHAETFAIKAIIKTRIIDLKIDKDVILEAIDAQLAKINGEIGPLEDQIGKL